MKADLKAELLLTSFAPWRKQQRSNSADDLLVGLQQQGLPDLIALQRQLPVNLPVAREIAIAKVQQFQPKILVLCGMATGRSRLSLEQQATVKGSTHRTSIDLEALAADLQITEISQDAGRYVCNSLYYAMLDYAVNHSQPRPVSCLFVHVPVITEENRSPLLSDMQIIIDRLLVQTRSEGCSQIAESQIADTAFID